MPSLKSIYSGFANYNETFRMRDPGMQRTVLGVFVAMNWYLLVALVGCLPSGSLLAANEAPAASPQPSTDTSAPNALQTYRFHCVQTVVQRWKRLIDETEDKSVFTGNVRIAFIVLPEGRPKNFEVVEQTEDAAALRRTALFAAAVSRFGTIPAEALTLLDGKPLRIEVKFSLRSK